MTQPYVGRPEMVAESFSLASELGLYAGHSFSAGPPSRKPKKECLCVYCGQKHPNVLIAVLCCLFAPAPTGWCAWCGDPVKGKGKAKKRSFCSVPCANSLRSDALLNRGYKQRMGA